MIIDQKRDNDFIEIPTLEKNVDQSSRMSFLPLHFSFIFVSSNGTSHPSSRTSLALHESRASNVSTFYDRERIKR